MADGYNNEDNNLLLAAEECPAEKFEQFHTFTRYERSIINRLIAHGPVLLRGGRGSGKSALLIQSHHTLQSERKDEVISVYISLRHLPLLRSEGSEYSSHFCRILSREVNRALKLHGGSSFPITNDIGSLHEALEATSIAQKKRIVLLFDDAAHIGRERPLEEFFDIFRTISTSRVSCKASIYPGVTKFGVRFDVFNDATVIDISRDERKEDFEDIFKEITRRRFPKLAERVRASRNISESTFAKLLGRAVAGNLRSYVYACNYMSNEVYGVGYQDLTKCFLELSANYFWPLLEEVEPKLGSYSVLVQSSQQVAEFIFKLCALKRSNYILVHRDIMQSNAKIYEILEYAGFISRREASRAMKSGGRGVTFAVNLCNLLDATQGRRLTIDLVDSWLSGTVDPVELHSSNPDYDEIYVPEVNISNIDGGDLPILLQKVSKLKKSRAYPYGLTDDKIKRLKDAGLITIGQVAEAPDRRILDIDQIGDRSLKRIRDAVYQAIWM